MLELEKKLREDTSILSMTIADVWSLIDPSKLPTSE